jgi:hypothetical protein
MKKTELLKNMYDDLKNGYTVYCNGCKIWMGESDRKSSNGRYRTWIFWENYGRSAERCTLQGLRFIVKVIAKSDDYSYTAVNY